MTSTDHRITGGCQCGTVRFACEGLGRASICHCRMCQKAFGGFYGPLVTVEAVTWTRGAPAHFRSSNVAQRGFCAKCGTPLTFETDGVAAIDIAIGAFDHPEAIRPVLQVGLEARLPWIDDLAGVPVRPPDEQAAVDARHAGIVSFQHPDHDTSAWPPPGPSE